MNAMGSYDRCKRCNESKYFYMPFSAYDEKKYNESRSAETVAYNLKLQYVTSVIYFFTFTELMHLFDTFNLLSSVGNFSIEGLSERILS